jgi:hypothetical protein
MNPDEANKAIEEGQVAGIVRAAVEHRVGILEEQYLSLGVSQYNTGRLTETNAMMVIASIAALRRFYDELERDIKKGQKALGGIDRG